MENIKREELERLVGIDKVNIFYDIVDKITKLYNMEQILKKLLFIKRKPNRK